MRAFVCGTSIMIAAAVAGGCSTPGAAAPTPQADHGAATGDGVMRAGGADVLRVTVPPGARCASTEGALRFVTPKYEVEMWLVPGAQTVGDGVARAAQQIAGEIKDFAPDHTTDLTIAGSPAERLVGPGHEADDGDDGAADVIVFKVGDHVFLACNHDEQLTPAGQAAVLALAQTARVP